MTQTTPPCSCGGDLRGTVAERYTELAEGGAAAALGVEADDIARRIGYDEAQLAALPEGANLGLGCGNPLALAGVRTGEAVVDLGSGAGIDAILAARTVGPAGRVIGVDMTDAMLDKARANVAAVGLANVEFRKGYIEALPLDDASADVLISNCVINLSPDKPAVFAEAFRVLRPGGRLAVSDLVLARELPPQVRNQVEAYVGCIAGAMLRDDYLAAIRAAGFATVEVVAESSYADVISVQSPAVAEMAAAAGLTAEQVADAADAVRSLKVVARKAPLAEAAG
ncbi:MAG TPA: arsenite methyltransferase [Candidatus Dormibacteraeota bacterium]|nr:arsenite methyltransferase [Candidatus Dormibacteraeota bacterium]